MLALVWVTGCSSQSPLVRENPILRKWFYPPDVGGGRPLGPDAPGATFDHGVYASLLKDFVDSGGRVDYGGLAGQADRLETYLEQIASSKPHTLSRYEHLALLLNAYNAFTLKLVLEHPGIESILEIPARDRWEAERWDVGGEKMSLLELEHERIRRVFRDPRVHFALVCASRGCPPLRSEPFNGLRLLEQLDDQARVFFADPKNARWDASARRLMVSELLDWYRGDFGGTRVGLLKYTMPFLALDMRSAVVTSAETARIGFLRYDWDLNGHW